MSETQEKRNRIFRWTYDNYKELGKKCGHGSRNNITDLVKDKFRIPYPIALDIVQSVSIMKGIGV